jgi:hypothetical protein
VLVLLVLVLGGGEVIVLRQVHGGHQLGGLRDHGELFGHHLRQRRGGEGMRRRKQHYTALRDIMLHCIMVTSERRSTLLVTTSLTVIFEHNCIL